MRWLFFFILLLNIFPAVFATNENASVERVSPGAMVPVTKGRSIVLLSEIESRERLNEATPALDEELPERREPGCFLVGPLVSQTAANDVATTFTALDYPIQSRWREVESGFDYWVFLPVQPSVRATSRLIQELSANEIDSFVIAEGDLEGALAVGVFGVKDNAARQQERLETMGYEAKIHPVQRWIREYWLMTESTPSPEDWRAIMNSVSNEELPQKMSRRSCKTVASALRFQ